MLKRHQVLLSDWIVEYLKKEISERYDLSFSEGIRGQLALAMIASIPAISKGYEPDLEFEQIMRLLQKGEGSTDNVINLHNFISKIYFEARKASEYRLKEAQKLERLKEE